MAWRAHSSAARVFNDYLIGPTIKADTDDLARFMRFMSQHWSVGAISTVELTALMITDYRSWLASLSAGDLKPASRGRALSSVRSFMEWMNNEGCLSNMARQTSFPGRGKTLPKALSVDQATELTTSAGIAHGEEAPWLSRRDKALMLLLWGSGLRIEEALSLTPIQALEADTLTVTGKSDKQRLVAVLPVVAEALLAYAQACPFELRPQDPLFRRHKGGRLAASVVRRIVGPCQPVDHPALSPT